MIRWCPGENFLIKNIEFTDILPIWEKELWPNRNSAIETHSAMLWPPEKGISAKTFKYTAHFLGYYIKDQLVGVNSCHRTDTRIMRSRGLWVNPDYRKQQIATKLLKRTIDYANLYDCLTLWTMPRITALSVYTGIGFEIYGNEITEDVEFGPNIYAYLKL